MKRRHIDDVRDKVASMANSFFYKRQIAQMTKARGRSGLGTPLSRAQQKSARCFLRQIHRKYSDVRWHQYYAGVTGAFYPNYVPEDIYYSAIEPTLNPLRRRWIYEDKNYYDRIGLPNTPQTLARIVSGRLLSADFEPIAEDDLVPALETCGQEIVIKPAIDTGGGRGVQFVNADVAKETIAMLRAGAPSQQQNYILQKAIRQHPRLSEINPTSVNTYRIVTLRHNEGISVLSTVLRVGRSDSRVDNVTTGGMACGINGGRLKRQAFVDWASRRYEAHPDSGYVFEGAELPCVGRAKEFCAANHKMLPDQDLASWDITVTEDEELTLIEVNVHFQEINFHQLCNGPLFGAHTTSVLSQVRFHMVGGLVTA